MEALREQWNNMCLSAGIPAISKDTCARILAVVYLYGNNEAFIDNKPFLADIGYIKARFGIYGGGIPDAGFIELLKRYIHGLEAYEKAHKDDGTEGGAVFKLHVQPWAIDLFKERYGIKLKS